MSGSIWNAKTYLLCVIVLLLFKSTATEQVPPIFRFDKTTFKCDHGQNLEDILRIEWKIETKSCAVMLLSNGHVDSTDYYCDLKNRAEMTTANLTITSMMSNDEGSLKCLVKTSPVTTLEIVSYDVIVNVRADNHSLLLDGNPYSCGNTVTVDWKENSTLVCAVDSRPVANITWFSQPAWPRSLLGTATSELRSDKVYHSANTLTLQNSDIPTSGVTVTCRIGATDNVTDHCIKLVIPAETTESISTTVDGIKQATSEPSTNHPEHAPTTEPSSPSQTSTILTTMWVSSSTAAPSKSKWKDIYILPIVGGVVIIIVVVIVIFVKCKDSPGSQQDNRQLPRSSHGQQQLAFVPPLYETIPDRPPSKPYTNPREPRVSNQKRYHHSSQPDRMSRIPHGTPRGGARMVSSKDRRDRRYRYPRAEEPLHVNQHVGAVHPGGNYGPYKPHMARVFHNGFMGRI